MLGRIKFGPGEKTRLFGTKDGDKYLCPEHAEKRYPDLGIPGGAAAVMFGMTPWPTGQEACDDCQTVS